jgi:formylglycine-generating enzyme required for sulfatase activity
MCWIPPGEFLMGSPVDELGRREGETQHRVEITRGFWMGKYPVTQAQWLAVMRNRPSWFGRPNFWDSLFDGNSKELWDHHPVERVSWNDVCGVENRSGGFLGKVNGGGTSGDYFHLPTEAQWEYACRAGTTGAYAGDLDQIAWYSANSGGKTHPVGTKKANAWGLHDMHGNVWEWCTDRYGNELAGGVDPQGAASGVSRVARGGSWNDFAAGCRAAYRGRFYPDVRRGNLGFRPALVPSK